LCLATADKTKTTPTASAFEMPLCSVTALCSQRPSSRFCSPSLSRSLSLFLAPSLALSLLRDASRLFLLARPPTALPTSTEALESLHIFSLHCFYIVVHSPLLEPFFCKCAFIRCQFPTILLYRFLIAF